MINLEVPQTVREAEKSIKKRMFGYIAGGLGLVVGLAWNDAIKVVIDYFIPALGATVIAKIIYALLLTLVVGLLMFYVERSLNKEDVK